MSILEPVGVGDAEETLYKAVLANPGATAAEIARVADMGGRIARGLLLSLEAKGLVTRSAARPPKYAPTPPDAALEVLLLRRQESLERVRMAVGEFQEEFRRSSRSAGPEDLVEMVVGKEAVAQRFAQLRESAREELLGLDKPPYATPPGEQGERAEVEALRKGVRYRGIYDRSALEYPGRAEEIQRVVAAGEEARFIRELPMKMAVADRRLALVPLSFEEPGNTGALIVHQSPLLDVLVAFFETLWERATPLGAVPPADAIGPERALPSPEDRQLLMLLMGGLKDQAISRQIGASHRTVQRRVRLLMEELGADTRFQAGCLAMQRGWLVAGHSGEVS